jgi:hypothetical protein
MKLIIAGSRGIHDLDLLAQAIDASGFDPITLVLSGGAAGVDRLGESWAQARGIPVRRFVPDWDARGRSAGILRNVEMAAEADAGGGPRGWSALWDGSSRGTEHMIREARRRGLRVHVHRVDL